MASIERSKLVCVGMGKQWFRFLCSLCTKILGLFNEKKRNNYRLNFEWWCLRKVITRACFPSSCCFLKSVSWPKLVTQPNLLIGRNLAKKTDLWPSILFCNLRQVSSLLSIAYCFVEKVYNGFEYGGFYLPYYIVLHFLILHDTKHVVKAILQFCKLRNTWL